MNTEKEKELYQEIKNIEHILTAQKTSVMDQIEINKMLDVLHATYPKVIFPRVYTGGCNGCLLELQRGLIPIFERLQMSYSDDQEVVEEIVEREQPKTRGRKKKLE